MSAYDREAFAVARTAMSFWHREPASPSYGSFDRAYWGWKKKDFADATLQAAVSLAVRLVEKEGGTQALPSLLSGFISYLESIQHADGSFDQVWPYERTPGVVHDLLTPLIWLHGRPHLAANDRARLEAIIHKGVAYTMRADEKHGEIANHFAGYAWELIHYGRAFGKPDAEARGRQYLGRTLALFNTREGWFREYDGADAGYQTRNLAFLTRIADLTGDDALWGVCAEAGRFVGRMLMPDGSLHPMLGVRSTALIYPSGLERLARRDPEFAPIAERIHASWESGASPRPSLIDFENALRLAEDAFEAERERSQRLAAPDAHAPKWHPAEFDLPDAGLHCRVSGGLAVHVGTKLGGPVVVYQELPEVSDRDWRLAGEDSGYLLVLRDGTRWLTRRADTGNALEVLPGRVIVETDFHRSLHDDLSPFQLIVLRILNLTVLRSQFLGDLFRKVVVGRLIAGHAALPVRLRREVEILASGVRITDRLAADFGLTRRLSGARLFRCRRAIANHMASSRYMQAGELALDQPWLEEIDIQALFDGRTLARTVG